MILGLTSGEQTTKLPAHSQLRNEKGKLSVVGRTQKNISADKRQTNKHLSFQFASVTSAAAQLKFLA